MTLPILPSDCHSLIYCFLGSADERLSFLSLAREIYFKSQSYREMKLSPTASRQYALNQSFREKIHSLVRPGHLHLNLSNFRQLTQINLAELRHARTLLLSNCSQLTDASVASLSLGQVETLDLSKCNQVSDEGVAHLGHVHCLNLSMCYRVTDEGLRHLGNVQTLLLSCC
jgi:hypothetical protein